MPNDSATNHIEPDALIDRRAVCRRLQISTSTAVRYERRGWLKSVRIGPRLIRFRIKDVIAFEEGR